jgi:protein phosphatase
VAAGILTEEEAKTHPLKNVVTRALGGGPSVSPDLQELAFRPGDEFIFCSDGLTTMLSDEEILDHAEKERDPQGLCRKLVDTANERGGVDNITVVVVRVPDGPAGSKSAPSTRR